MDYRYFRDFGSPLTCSVFSSLLYIFSCAVNLLVIVMWKFFPDVPISESSLVLLLSAFLSWLPVPSSLPCLLILHCMLDIKGDTSRKLWIMSYSVCWVGSDGQLSRRRIDPIMLRLGLRLCWGGSASVLPLLLGHCLLGVSTECLKYSLSSLGSWVWAPASPECSVTSKKVFSFYPPSRFFF